MRQADIEIGGEYALKQYGPWIRILESDFFALAKRLGVDTD